MDFLITNSTALTNTRTRIHLFILALFLVTACGENTTPTPSEKEQVTVTFNRQGGFAVPEAIVEKGKAVAEPTAPTRAGFVFKGWFTDEGATKAYSFDTPVNANLTLYPKWANIFTLSFDSQGGSDVDYVTVEDGQPVAEPTPPTRPGFVFGGWFTDEAATPVNVYVFTTPVSMNITLYAKWTKGDPVVTFDSQGGSAVAAITVADGQLVAEPIPPTRANSVFKGWFIDQNTTTAYVFSTPVTTNLTLYAKWTNSFTVKLNTDASTLLATQTVSTSSGGIFQKQPFVGNNLYITGYFTNVGKTTAFDFDNALTTDTTLYVNTRERVRPASKAELVTLVNAAVTDATPSPDLNYINTEDITNMDELFFRKGGFNGDVSLWDVSNVNSMHDMFRNTGSFNQDISGWNVGLVTDMEGMFELTAFNQDISGWNVGNVENMEEMFFLAGQFNQDISGWDVGKVSNMRNMFAEASAFDQNLEVWGNRFRYGVRSVDIFFMFFRSGVTTPPSWYPTDSE